MELIDIPVLINGFCLTQKTIDRLPAMKKNYIIGIIFSALIIGAKPSDQFPQAEISNGIIHATLYLPDAKDGYYRGSRFDWSGVMPALEYKGPYLFRTMV